MSEQVKLTNVGKEQVVFNIPHDLYCVKAGECLCADREIWLRPSVLGPRRPSGGRIMSSARQSKKVRTPASLTLQPGEKSGPLHKAVLDLPGIRPALRAPNRRLKYENGGE